jgi:uncharacterized protein with PIN domain
VAIASVRLYGALNDFLPEARRQTTLVCELKGRASVKDLIESLGVPHPEIDRLIVNGSPVDFTYIVRDGDRVAAFPPFLTLDLGDDARLGPPDQGHPRLVADVHLGALASYLRLAGFDTRYRNDYSDARIAAISAEEDRVLLTRDLGVLKHRIVRRGYYVRETRPARQFVEVLRRFDLPRRAAPFTRCLECNELLQVVPKHRVEHLLPERTRHAFERFARCPACARVYWEGSHYSRLSAFLEAALHAAGRR